MVALKENNFKICVFLVLVSHGFPMKDDTRSTQNRSVWPAEDDGNKWLKF